MIPGPQGERGEKGADSTVTGPAGKDGRDGRDGKDGIASIDEVRAVSAKAVDDRLEETVQKRVQEAFDSVPWMVFRDLWKPGTEYRAGDCVVWGGSSFHCNEPTSAKPGDSKAWSLMARRGRDGKDVK